MRDMLHGFLQVEYETLCLPMQPRNGGEKVLIGCDYRKDRHDGFGVEAFGRSDVPHATDFIFGPWRNGTCKQRPDGL